MSTKQQSTKNTNNFNCHICLDDPVDPVVTICGHLFCWPCLNQWIDVKGNYATCPVCKAGVTKQSVVPIYVGGTSTAENNDNKSKSKPNR